MRSRRANRANRANKLDVVGSNVNTRMQLLLILVVAAQSLLLVHCF